MFDFVSHRFSTQILVVCACFHVFDGPWLNSGIAQQSKKQEGGDIQCSREVEYIPPLVYQFLKPRYILLLTYHISHPANEIYYKAMLLVIITFLFELLLLMISLSSSSSPSSSSCYYYYFYYFCCCCCCCYY